MKSWADLRLHLASLFRNPEIQIEFSFLTLVVNKKIVLFYVTNKQILWENLKPLEFLLYAISVLQNIVKMALVCCSLAQFN